MQNKLKRHPEIIIKNYGTRTEIFIDGKLVYGATSIKFVHEVNDLPSLELRVTLGTQES